MKDKRRLDAPIYPYFVFLMGLVFVFSSLLIYLNFADAGRVALGTFAGGLMIVSLAFLLYPPMFTELVSNRKTLLWVNDVVLVLIIIGIAIVLSYIGFRRNVRYDFTRNKMFSISDQTRQFLRKLDKDVKITAFYPRNTREEQMVKELLDEYKRQTTRLKVKFVDPFRDPMTVKAMKINSPGTIVVQCEASRKDIPGTDIFDMPQPGAGPDARPKFKGEQVITTSLINVTSGIKRKIAFVSGHGEASISGYNGRDVAGLHELLTRENYDVDEINLVDSEIEENISMLAVISPQRDFLDLEIERLRKFIKERHGHLIIALDPLSETDNFEGFLLNEFGVMANNDVVVDPRGIQREYWTVAPEYTRHEALEPLKSSNLISIMFHCRSLNVEGREGYKATDFLDTIEAAWAKRGLKSGQQIEIAFDEKKDAKGPLKLGVIIEDSQNASGSKILVLGDSDFISNSYIGFGGNKDLLINTINWMYGQDTLISIRPKVLEVSQVVLDDEAASQIFTLSVIMSPLFIVVFGAGVFLYRRRM